MSPPRTNTTPRPRPAAKSAAPAVRILRPSDLPAPLPRAATVAMARELIANMEVLQPLFDEGMSEPLTVPYARLVLELAARIAELEAERK